MADQIIQELQDIKTLLGFSKSVWSLKEFCSYAGISMEYGYQLTRSGKLKFYRPFGKKIYMDREHAIEALKQNPICDTSSLNQIAIKSITNNKIKH